MSNYYLEKYMESILKRLEAAENRLEDIEEFGSCCKCDKFEAAKTPFLNRGNDALGDYLIWQFGPERTCLAMEVESASIKIYKTGAFESSTTLYNRSRSSKMGNMYGYVVGVISSGQTICSDMGTFNANFDPVEPPKTYPLSGTSYCARDNWQFLEDRTFGVGISWTCFRR